MRQLMKNAARSEGQATEPAAAAAPSVGATRSSSTTVRHLAFRMCCGTSPRSRQRCHSAQRWRMQCDRGLRAGRLVGAFALAHRSRVMSERACDRRSSWIFGRTRHRVARSASCPGTSCPNTDIRRCVRGCLAGSRSLERQRWRHGRQQRPPERFEIVHAQCPLRGRQVVGP